MASRESGGGFRRLLGLVAVAAILFLGLALFRAGAPPTITLEPSLPGIGKRTEFRVRAAEPKRGLSALRVEIEQSGRIESLASRSYTPREPWQFWGKRTTDDELRVEVGSLSHEWLREGPATVRVVADRAKSWLRRPDPSVEALEIAVKLQPPSLEVISDRTFVSQGGAEAVVYRVGPSAVRDGVRAGDWWFPGYPLPGEPEKHFALFAAPYDMDNADDIRLVAVDDVGNEARTPFIDRFSERAPSSDTIRLTESFLARVIPPILSQTPEVRDRGELLANYLAINGELRKINNDTLKRLAAGSATEFLWRGPFLQMRNAQVMSDFADRRVYLFDGRAVDRQDHLGFDLASTRRAEIQAGNAGRIVLARYFGIYGNTIVIDHGYGLMSLYGHLSSLAVRESDTVARGDVIGRSGATGLAGGDHLHFTIMIQGLPVNPREWWDAKWIQNRLKLKLGSALPGSGT